MSNYCINENFPKKLDIENKSIDEIVDEATSVLIKDFSLGMVKFRSKEIKVKYPYQDKYSFEHILKLDDPNISTENKILRCLYAPKFKALLEEIENKSCKNFKYWKEYNSKRHQWRHIIMCIEEKLIIILVELKGYFLLVTAYYANYPHYIKSQLKKYNSSNYKLK